MENTRKYNICKILLAFNLYLTVFHQWLHLLFAAKRDVRQPEH